MLETGKSCLCTETREYTLEAFGKNRREAVGAIFARFKRAVYADVPGLIIHMEPEDVVLLEEEEKTAAQKVLGFFAPRELQNHRVKVRVLARVKYIPGAT